MQEQKKPTKPSGEATEEQLAMAKNQGEVLEKALNHMLTEVATDGQEKHAGPYLVSYAVEEAEGMYHLEGDELVWREPEEKNAHVEVAVRDAADGRFIPGLNIYVRLRDEEHNEIGCHRQPFVWHPWLYHYGRNWQVPGDGNYHLEIHIEAPDFPRHDEKNGRRYATDVGVEFSPIKIETGQD